MFSVIVYLMVAIGAICCFWLYFNIENKYWGRFWMFLSGFNFGILVADLLSK